MKIRPSVLAAAALVAMAAGSVHADWIVTRDGERFEIKGAWQQKGKLAVFTLPDGTLSSIRADRLDPDASRRLTEESRQAKPNADSAAPSEAAGKARRKAVIVLTDKDFASAKPKEGTAEGAKGATATERAAAAREGAAGTGEGAAASPATAKDGKTERGSLWLREVPNAVTVVSWERVPANKTKVDGTELSGVLRNVSPQNLSAVSVVADLFDDNGTILAKIPATVDTEVLPAGESTPLHVAAHGIFNFATIRWETHGKAILLSAPPAAPGARAAPPGGPAAPSGAAGAAGSSTTPPSGTPPPPPPPGRQATHRS
jgi:hypothetical protein